jgi:hypothetical protein
MRKIFKFLNIKNLKILTILIGLIATLILMGSFQSYGFLRISPPNKFSSSYLVEITRDFEIIIYCWFPYFFVKVLDIFFDKK